MRKLESWIDYPEGAEFSIYNLPYGVFESTEGEPTIGVAIGDQIVDMAELAREGYLDTMPFDPDIFLRPTLNDFISEGKNAWSKVRELLIELLQQKTGIVDINEFATRILVPQSEVRMLLPVSIGDYTDFYSSEDHATNVGKMFRDPNNALLPNWKHIPVGYHGRASSIIVSGQDIHRPKGQTMPPGAERPVFGPSKRMDFELEVAFITSDGPALGKSISTEQAEDHIFGFALFNDWSARDIQKWEYVPLGPFLGKNFASSLSPWIVTVEALEPFRIKGVEQVPEVLDYLKYEGMKNFDIPLELSLGIKGKEYVISESNLKYMYWNPSQQLAHHTVNGCNVRTGDLMASGTISGPTKSSFGSMLELSWSGKEPLVLEEGLERTFLEDGDEVIIRAKARKGDISIGFGEVRSRLLPALP